VRNASSVKSLNLGQLSRASAPRPALIYVNWLKQIVTVSLLSAAGLCRRRYKRHEPAKAGSFSCKILESTGRGKVLRKVLPKVLKGTWRYDVLQNVTDRITRQELSMRGCIVTQTTALMLMPQSPIDADGNLVIIAPVWPNIAAGVTIMGDEPRLVSVDPAGRRLAARRSSDCGRFSQRSHRSGKLLRQPGRLGLGAASTPPLRLC
jgi:hypothetical protein